MASSGSKTTKFSNGKYYLKLTWTTTSQSVANNTSNVTAKLYIGSYGSGYGINASATKSGSITLDGTTTSFSVSGISLSSGGEVLLKSVSKTISHSSDGTKSFSLNATFNPAVTISGTYMGSLTVGAYTGTLNTIPRASSLTSGASWTAGGTLAVSISRKSTSFTHDVTVKVGSTTIGTWTGIGASKTITFTTAQNTSIFTALAQNATATTTITMQTKSGSTNIGSAVSKTGTVTAPNSSTTTHPSSFNIGSAISGTINENNSGFTHTLQLLQSNGSTVIATILNKSATLSWSYTPTASTLYALTPNSNSYTGKIKLITYYNGVQVRTPRTANITFKVTNSNPTFTPTITYSDTNTTISAVTGNNQYLVQGKSKLQVKATVSSTTLTAKNSATIKTIQCTIAGKTVSQAYSSSATAYTFNVGVLNSSSNQSCTISAIDSRGNKTTVSKVVYFVPYSAPKLSVSAKRQNNFGTIVEVSMSGTLSPVTISGTQKNTIKSALRYYLIDGGSYSSAASFDYTVSGSAFKHSSVAQYTYPVTSVGKIKVVITDSIGSSVTVEVDVATGQPLFYLDAEDGSASFNTLPAYPSTMSMGLKLDCARNQFWGGGKASYGLNLGNSDIVHVNSMVFGDYCNNLGEGLRFPNTSMSWNTDYGHQNDSVAKGTTTDMKLVYGDYTNVAFRNQEIWIDGAKFIKFERTPTEYTNDHTNNVMEFFAKTYKFNNISDVAYSHENGLIIKDNSGYRLHIDANELIWTKDYVMSPNYMQASTHNIQAMSTTDGTTTLARFRVTSDSVGGYCGCDAFYNRTTTATANLYVNSSGTIFRSTSSKASKLDIVPAFNSVDEYKKILDIEPVKWFDKTATERTAEILTAEYLGEEYDDGAGTGNLNRVYGCVAEQLEEVGLGCLVTYDDVNTNITGVAYDRIPIMYIPLIKDLYNQIEEMKEEIKTLKGEV